MTGSQHTSRNTGRALPVPEACEALGLSRQELIRLIDNGEIAKVTIAGSVRIPVDAIQAWVAKTAPWTEPA